MGMRKLRIAIPILEAILTRGECFEPVNVPADLRIEGCRFGPNDTLEVSISSREFIDEQLPDLEAIRDPVPGYEEGNGYLEVRAHGDVPGDGLFAIQYRRRCEHGHTLS